MTIKQRIKRKFLGWVLSSGRFELEYNIFPMHEKTQFRILYYFNGDAEKTMVQVASASISSEFIRDAHTRKAITWGKETGKVRLRI